jgi:hypothetical protein
MGSTIAVSNSFATSGNNCKSRLITDHEMFSLKALGGSMTVTTTDLRKPANRRAARHMTAMLAALTIVLVACSTFRGTDMPTDRTDRPTYRANEDLTQQTYATTEQVLAAVAAAQQTQVLPDVAAKQLATYSDYRDPDRTFQSGPEHCFDTRQTHVTTPNTTFGECAYGDPNGTKHMVVYGDSHAPMWAATLERVAAISGWQVRVFAKGGCQAADLQYQDNVTHAPDSDCDTFHSTAVDEIRKLHPQLVITASGAGNKLANGDVPTTSQWQDALVSTFHKLAQPGTHVAILGALPEWQNNDALCLAAHTRDIQVCSTERANAVSPFFDAERAAASAAGALYVDTVPWVCAEKCEPVISDIVVYYNPWHFTTKYANYLTGAVADALKPAMT